MVKKMGPETTVIICTINRAAALDETVRSLMALPGFNSDIVISAGSKSSLLPGIIEIPNLTVIDHITGLTRQRNAALSLVRSRYSLFIDDDVELDRCYVANMESLMRRERDIALSTGEVVPGTRKLVTRNM